MPPGCCLLLLPPLPTPAAGPADSCRLLLTAARPVAACCAAGHKAQGSAGGQGGGEPGSGGGGGGTAAAATQGAATRACQPPQRQEHRDPDHGSHRCQVALRARGWLCCITCACAAGVLLPCSSFMSCCRLGLAAGTVLPSLPILLYFDGFSAILVCQLPFCFCGWARLCFTSLYHKLRTAHHILEQLAELLFYTAKQLAGGLSWHGWAAKHPSFSPPKHR